MRKVVVTGGSGKAGRAVVHDLLEHGYEVLNADLLEPHQPASPFIKTNLAALGETFEVLQEARSVREQATDLRGALEEMRGGAS